MIACKPTFNSVEWPGGYRTCACVPEDRVACLFCPCISKRFAPSSTTSWPTWVKSATVRSRGMESFSLCMMLRLGNDTEGEEGPKVSKHAVQRSQRERNALKVSHPGQAHMDRNVVLSHNEKEETQDGETRGTTGLPILCVAPPPLSFPEPPCRRCDPLFVITIQIGQLAFPDMRGRLAFTGDRGCNCGDIGFETLVCGDG